MSVPSGLTVLYERVSPEREHAIINYLDSQPWSTELSRRTQHYGTAYNYQSRNLAVQPAPPLAGEVLAVAQWLTQHAIIQPFLGNGSIQCSREACFTGATGSIQCIANEYYRDQGIAPHVDREVFGDTVVGISLGADAVMEFTRGDVTYSAWLPRRSLMIMTGEARYMWKHSIPKRVKYQDPTGTTVTKPADYRRISLTYRKVL
jgi:alkylated DNA repair dioxygenase AlkB